MLHQRKEAVWVNSLLNKYELKGKTEKEIISLLGEPQSKRKNPELEFVYYLGQGAFGLDDNLFILQFDQNGKLEKNMVAHP